jgi:hypothetical protein
MPGLSLLRLLRWPSGLLLDVSDTGMNPGLNVSGLGLLEGRSAN